MNDDVVKDIIQWQRIGCIVVRLSERLNISPIVYPCLSCSSRITSSTT
jgi:hypothetical protein